MKKLLCVAAFLVLAAGLPLWGYDTSPSYWQIVPEVIWAAATGGGTWVTEIQITNLSQTEASLWLFFDTAAGSDASGILIGPIPGLNSVKYSNILATMDALDSTDQVYYGNVGALFINVNTTAGLIQVQAQTVNGNYGKTFPGLNVVAGNTVAQGRPMMIQGLVRNATYRTSVGIYNPGGISYTVRFTIYDATHGTVGSYFERTLGGYGFSSFNPFVQAGITTGDYDNCYLYIEVTVGDASETAPMVYGSIANNYTNDTYALMGKQYGAGGAALPTGPGRY